MPALREIPRRREEWRNRHALQRIALARRLRALVANPQENTVKINAIMNRFPQTVQPLDTLIDARKVMLAGGFRHAPVIDRESNRLVGLITQGDIARHQARVGESIWSSPTDTVEMAMSSPVHTASPNDSLIEAAARMVNEKIGCLPITEFGKLIGIITTEDVLSAEVQAEMHAQRSNGASVGDVMTRNPQTVSPEDLLLDGAARMAQYQVRHLPVIDGDQHIVGMLSDRDVRAAIGDPGNAFSDAPSVGTSLLHVRDAMSKPPIVVTPDQSCTEVAHALAKLRASTVPVSDENNKLIGVLSYVDLLRAFAA